MRLTNSLVASFAVLVFAFMLSPGCGPSEKTRTYTVPKEKEPDAKPAPEADPKGPYRLLGAIIPVGLDPDGKEKSRFVKFSGLADNIDPHEKPFDVFLNSIRLSVDPSKVFDFTEPANARKVPLKQFRLVTFQFGTDEKPADLYISDPFGGTLLENVNRWRGEVGLPAVKESDLKDVTKEIPLGTLKAYRVDFKGPGGKGGGMRGPFQPK